VPGFDSIIDQERPIRILTSLLVNGTVPHALLFTGIEGVGKKTAAVALAMACNCTGQEAGTEAARTPSPGAVEPCGECAACRKIAGGAHPDILRVSPAGAMIKIDQIRELCQVLTMRPYEARVRVVIIADAHTLNPAAGNALLKMLEEPPARTVLILTAPQTGDLLPTIVSRCRHIRFKPIARHHLAAILTRVYGVDPPEASLTAALAGGSLTRALTMRQGRWLQRRRWLMAQLAALPRQSTAALLALAEKLSQDRENLPDTLDLIASWIRDLAVARYAPEHLIHQDLREALVAISQTLSLESLTNTMRALQDTRRRIQANANPRLTLEALFVKMAKHLDQTKNLLPGHPY
jgi:DNA polymerase-3 subunit delta'